MSQSVRFAHGWGLAKALMVRVAIITVGLFHRPIGAPFACRLTTPARAVERLRAAFRQGAYYFQPRPTAVARWERITWR